MVIGAGQSCWPHQLPFTSLANYLHNLMNMKNLNAFTLFFLLLAFSVNAQTLKVNTMPDKIVQPNEVFDVGINVVGFEDIQSLQFGVVWDPAVIDFVAIHGHQLPDVTIDNINTMYTDEGKLRFLWEDAPLYLGQTIDDNTSIFNIRFKAVGAAAWSTSIEVAGDSLPSFFPLEFVDVDGVDLAASGDLEIEAGIVTIDGVNASKETVTQDFTLYQNNPNPFSTETNISFYLNQSSSTQLSIHDHTGRVVFERNNDYTGGLHTIQVSRDLFTSAGSYFFTLKTENATATRQLVVQ